MDWELAIERNREALLRLLALAFANAGLKADDRAPVLARAARLRLLRMLRPAEAAVRRLIVILAWGLKVTLRASTPGPVGVAKRSGAARMRAFTLLDPLRQVAVARARAPQGLRISLIGIDERPADPSPRHDDDLVDGAQLARRMAALQRALADLPREARRLARWRVRRRLAGGPGRVSPLRSGRPPGFSARSRHPLAEILSDCDGLARMAMVPPDTS